MCVLQDSKWSTRAQIDLALAEIEEALLASPNDKNLLNARAILTSAAAMAPAL